MRTFKIEPYWSGLGIKCTCGCRNGEFEVVDPQPAGQDLSKFDRIRCSITHKMGYIKYDGSVRRIIMNVSWDK